MKYEVRMTIDFRFRDKQGYLNNVKRSTIIDYIDAKDIAEAYIKAAKNKFSIATDIAKEMQNTNRWGGTINKISISLDAVVAKPEFSMESLERKADEMWKRLNETKKPKKNKVLQRVMYYLEDARKRIENYLAECDVHESPPPSEPQPPTPQ